MAIDKTDSTTAQLPELTPQQRQWVTIGLNNIEKGIIRNRALVAADSAMYKAMTSDMEAVQKLKEKFK